MKTLAFILLILFFWFSASAQVVAIQCVKAPRMAYVGLDNPLKVAVDGYPGSALMVTVDNGGIDGSNGDYIFTPKYPSDSITIRVQVRTPTQIKEVQKIKVKLECFPIDSTTFMGHRSGFITAGQVRVAIGLDGNPQGFELTPHFHVTGFKVRVIRDGEEILSKSLSNRRGARFVDDEEVERVMSNINAGDSIIFTNITYLGYGECTGTMKSMEFVAN
ncbi:hypothetical protein CJD36_020095 [Flavipsychrobacter stenotrophus]|uniref:Uncharacterized protein n=1 Tax=Flavipsychrobacter stenotrophus TaxID=2077091 RepID=A0A2S7SSD1_9BACT|nr:GldM family protein [Flavipsychrobacter stenotrophus]PQJ09541.1 hypothetical protein CJD36_020095 [Flavipsychrobacter stenotrophus]